MQGRGRPAAAFRHLRICLLARLHPRRAVQERCGENRVEMGKLVTGFGVLMLACIADAPQAGAKSMGAQPARALRRALTDGSLSAALATDSALPRRTEARSAVRQDKPRVYEADTRR